MTEKPESAIPAESTETGKGQTLSEDKAGKNHSTTSSAKRNGDGHEETPPMTRWPWLAQMLFALVIIIAVVVLLVGLPTASLLVAERMSSVSDGGSLRGMVSFWGAMFAAFISLVLLFIGAVFAFTALKVESDAKWQAQKAVRKGVEKGIQEAREAAERGHAETNKVLQGIIKNQAKDYIKLNGKEITERVAQSYVNTNGEEITREVADVYAKNYVDHNGPVITEKAADAFVDRNGAEITRGVVDGYVKEIDVEGEPPRGERITRQAAEDYVKGVVDGYASENLEDEDMTRVEKMTRETVKKISADEIARLVDEYLASLRLVDRLRIGFRQRGRDDGLDTAGDGRR